MISRYSVDVDKTVQYGIGTILVLITLNFLYLSILTDPKNMIRMRLKAIGTFMLAQAPER